MPGRRNRQRESEKEIIHDILVPVDEILKRKSSNETDREVNIPLESKRKT
jgi:hypothetical protein